MIRSLLKTLVFCIAAFVAMPLCAFSSSNSDTTVFASAERMRKYEYFLHEANRQNMQGNYDATVELLGYCLELNPNSDVALYEMAKFLDYLQQDSISEIYLKKAVGLNPVNYWYSNALVGAYVKKGKINEAISVAEELSRKNPKKSDVLIMLIELYTRNEDYTNVIKTLDRLEVKQGKSEQLSMQKFRIYVQMKDEKRAYEEIMNLANEYPYDLRYKVLLGDLYMNNGHKEKAFEVYRAVEKEDSTNINVMLSLADYYNKQSMDSLYRVQIERLIKSDRLNSDTKLQIMTGVVYDNIANKGDTAKILNMFDRILATPQENSGMAELCVRYMVSSDVPNGRIKPVLRLMLDIEPENDIARSQLLSYAVQENDTAAIAEVCKPAIAYSASDPIYYYYLGIIYFQRNEFLQAIETLQKGLTKVNDDTQTALISNSYTLLGDLYHEIGDDQSAYAAYDSCLIYNPEDVGALNNYAYYLSLNNENLERAEKMSAKTIVAEPENYTYIDTYAWILFMQGRYTEAKEQIDKALLIMGDSINVSDSNIVEHAGDIYFKSGDKDGAIRLWIKAQELGGSDAPNVLERKIKKRKYIKN